MQLISGSFYAEAEQLSQVSGVIPVTQVILEREGLERVCTYPTSKGFNLLEFSGYSCSLGSPAFPANDSHFGCSRFTNVTPHVLRMTGANLPSTFDVISIFWKGGGECANRRRAYPVGERINILFPLFFGVHNGSAAYLQTELWMGKMPLRVNIFIALYA